MEVLQRTANRGSISTGYNIDNSLKLEPDNSEKIYRPSGLGTSVTSTKGTISYWHKTTELASGTTFHWVDGTATQNHYASLNGDNVFYIAGRNESVYKLLTTRVFRDTSAWYHFVIVYDTTQATASDRIKLYVNGVQETDFTTANYPAQNLDLRFLTVNGQTHIGNNTATASRAGYYSEIYFLDGQTYAPTDFGEFDSDTGIWKPTEFQGSFGSNDYYLDFESSGSLGADASGNSNNWSLQNITSIDQATDTPTNNFATFNPIININSTLTYTDGATEAASSAINSLAEGTIGFTNGNWYYEIVMPAASPNPNANMMMGFGRPNLWGIGQTDPGMDTYSFAYNRTGVVFYNGTTTSGWSAYSKDDVVMVAIDTTNGFAYFGVNGTWGNGGVPTSGASGTGAFDYDSLVTNVAIGDLLIPAFSTGNAGNILQINFGGYTEVSIASGNTDENDYGNFEYAPPSGYYALCSKNLAEFG
jgi:hypothetical protein